MLLGSEDRNLPLRVWILGYLAKGKKDNIQKSRGYPTQAEAYNLDRGGRNAEITTGNGAVAGNIVPATAPPHTGVPARRAGRIVLGIAAVAAIPIPTPFPDVSAHVMKP